MLCQKDPQKPLSVFASLMLPNIGGQSCAVSLDVLSGVILSYERLTFGLLKRDATENAAARPYCIVHVT
jgi:hypothetical protein